MFNGEAHLKIIDNKNLNGALEILAGFVTNSGIKSANQKIASNVRDIFNRA